MCQVSAQRQTIVSCEARRLTLTVCCLLAPGQMAASALALAAFEDMLQSETTCIFTEGSRFFNRATCNYCES